MSDVIPITKVCDFLEVANYYLEGHPASAQAQALNHSGT